MNWLLPILFITFQSLACSSFAQLSEFPVWKVNDNETYEIVLTRQTNSRSFKARLSGKDILREQSIPEYTGTKTEKIWMTAKASSTKDHNIQLELTLDRIQIQFLRPDLPPITTDTAIEEQFEQHQPGHPSRLMPLIGLKMQATISEFGQLIDLKLDPASQSTIDEATRKPSYITAEEIELKTMLGEVLIQFEKTSVVDVVTTKQQGLGDEPYAGHISLNCETSVGAKSTYLGKPCRTVTSKSTSLAGEGEGTKKVGDYHISEATASWLAHCRAETGVPYSIQLHKHYVLQRDPDDRESDAFVEHSEILSVEFNSDR